MSQSIFWAVCSRSESISLLATTEATQNCMRRENLNLGAPHSREQPVAYCHARVDRAYCGCGSKIKPDIDEIGCRDQEEIDSAIPSKHANDACSSFSAFLLHNKNLHSRSQISLGKITWDYESRLTPRTSMMVTVTSKQKGAICSLPLR